MNVTTLPGPAHEGLLLSLSIAQFLHPEPLFQSLDSHHMTY